MPKLYKILWSLMVLFIILTVITFTFGLILVGAAIVGLFGIYRYYLARTKSRNISTKSRNISTWPKKYSTCEIIDITSETIPNSTRNLK